MSGVKPQDLDNPHEFPMMYVHVWDAFLRLNNARTSNGFGANQISYLDIDAYCRVTGSAFNEHELDLIKQLDSMNLKHINKETK
jgi:hypothetical protein